MPIITVGASVEPGAPGLTYQGFLGLVPPLLGVEQHAVEIEDDGCGHARSMPQATTRRTTDSRSGAPLPI